MLLVAACRSGTYTATGEVIEIDAAATHVTIDHDDVPGLMPAMRMRFAVRDTRVLEGIAPGTEVRFALARDGAALVVTDVRPVGGAPRPRPGIHDHRPHHDGVVTMVGLRHVEVAAAPDGRVRVYLTDAWRRPLPLDGWRGRVVLDHPGGSQAVELSAGGDAMAGTGPALPGREVLAHLHLSHAGEPTPLEAHLTVPLQAGVAGAAVAPVVRCDAAAAADAPRCTLDFSQGITALGVVPGTTHVVLGIMNAGVSVWDVTSGAFVRAFDPPPAVEAAAGGAPHPEVVDALGIARDGQQTIVASEGRLLRHATDSGRLLRVLSSPEPLLRAIVWEPAGVSFLVHGAYAAQAWRVAATDGTHMADLRMPARVTAVAVSSDGGTVVLGDESGQVRAFDGSGDATGRPVVTVAAPVRGVGLAGPRVVVATGAGTVEVFDTARAAPLARSAPASPCYRLAVSEHADRAACAAFDRTIRLYDLSTGEVATALAWHQALVLGLDWAGTTLVSGDGAGRLAVWEVGVR